MKIDTNNNNNNDNNVFPQIEIYVGIQSIQCEGSPSICVEFDISPRVFIIALALAQMEKKCEEEK
ncbi:hypothetical protein CLLI_20510 [Clostridium liquoris]|jgi:hypothetical protein|uniref:Uncharacterized protein n=1 Tax=Clostridium liquoris TaxID=1289519 RepID=A0A2T0B266_9CLOT|nr:hypothetical protein [Clostridium liquoris]PRR77956.1 hypothetical protein CLLI_20510 [Clostridium liquoris]